MGCGCRNRQHWIGVFHRKPAPSDWWHPIFHDRTPVSFGISSLAQTYILQPNMLNLIMLRIHRWTMGQSVEFFENDFAGRIAQKEMQTATSATNVVIEFVHTIVFSIASVLGAWSLSQDLIHCSASLSSPGWWHTSISSKPLCPRCENDQPHMRTHAPLLWAGRGCGDKRKNRKTVCQCPA